MDWVPTTVGRFHTTAGFLHGFAGSVCDGTAVPMPGKLQAGHNSGSAHPQLSDSLGKQVTKSGLGKSHGVQCAAGLALLPAYGSGARQPGLAAALSRPLLY